jgi:uroporphyrinogen decarboxylase
MTPRERAIEALELRRPPGLVPHLELEFQLSQEVFGQPALRAEHLQGITGARRQDLLKRNAEHWVKVAREFDYSVITGLHWLSADDQLASFEYVRDIAGDTYMLSAFVDGTFAIPSGENMIEHVVFLTERKQAALEDAQRRVEEAIALGLRLIGGGAEVIFMCADYCFNDGPFLSPAMFGEYIAPYLRQQVAAWNAAGAYTVKHTDGDIMPVLDQLADSGAHALHSLDPMAGVDIAEVKRRVGDRMCLIGNVNLAYVQSGTPEQITESARYCLRHGGVNQGGYIYATSNCIFSGVPIESYRRLLRVREEYGYPGAQP